MPLLDARAAEVAFAVVALLALNNDAVAECAFESLNKRGTPQK